MTIDPDPNVERSGIWQPGVYELVFGDVLGNGTVELLIRPYGSHDPAFLVAASLDTGTPILLQVIFQDEFQVDFGASQATVQLEDINADGRADLVINVIGQPMTVFQLVGTGAVWEDGVALDSFTPTAVRSAHTLWPQRSSTQQYSMSDTQFYCRVQSPSRPV